MIRVLPLVALLLASALPAVAQEGDACARFAWSLTAERELMTKAAPTTNGSAWDGRGAVALTLRPIAGAELPMPPERGSGPQAGFVRIAAPPTGRVQVTASDEVWIDVIQDGRYARTLGHTGVKGCPGLRKSIRYDLAPGPVVIQASGPDVSRVSITLTAVP